MNDQQERILDLLLTTLDVAESDAQLARALCHRAFAADLHHGRGGTTIAASAVYAALRQTGEPHSLDEIAEVAGVDRPVLGRTYKLLVRELDLDIEPADPHEFVDRFGDRLDVEEATESTAHDLVDAAAEADIRSGHSPTGTTAGALYLAGLLTGDRYHQDDVAETAEVAAVTLRDRFHEQAALLGIDQWARPVSSPLASAFDTSELSIEAVNEQLEQYQILEFTDDLFTSPARCIVCEQTSEYGHLVQDHYTKQFDFEQRCYETAADLTDLLGGFEVLELADQFHDTRVRCTHCGDEGTYTVLSDHQLQGFDDFPTCVEWYD